MLAIDVQTPLGFRVTCTTNYSTRIETTKHPAMRGRLAEVSKTLQDPDEVRRSLGDAAVLLFHRRVEPRWVCAVVKRTAEAAYLITAYPADKVKQGEIVWKK
jgi:hypothetical protein